MTSILHEVDSSISDIKSDHFSSSFNKLARVSQIQEQLKSVWDVLATLTPSEYVEFRDQLGNASGFQSYQNRLIEFALGYKTEHVLKIYEHEPALLEVLQTAQAAPSLYDVSIQALARAGLTIDDAVLKRDVSLTHQSNESVKHAWITMYRDVAK